MQIVCAIALGLWLSAAVVAAPTSVPAQHVTGEYVAGGAYCVQYEADEFGFRARVQLIDGLTDVTTPQTAYDLPPGALTKPQDDESIGCALRNSLCGK